MVADWDIFEFASLTSTQDQARDVARTREGNLKPFVVRADMQSAGRGRSGRTWISQEGNLLCTLCLPQPATVARDVAQYSFLAAVAVTDALASCGVDLARHDVRHKWPNDVLVGGRKISGILLESRLGAEGAVKHLFIGLGVNVQTAPEGAARVGQLLDRDLTPQDFLQSYLHSFDRLHALMLDQGFSPVREAWLARAYGIGERLQVRLVSEAFNGIFDGLEDDGALRVMIEGQQLPRIVHAGDVFFGQESPHVTCD